MQTLTILTTFLLSASLALSGTVPSQKCGTCNPVSGQNFCDQSTSCISTGTKFHCACRAGYKASEWNNNIHKQFRLPMPNYEFLVFVPEHTPCDTLCEHPYGAPSEICQEVPLYEHCPV